MPLFLGYTIIAPSLPGHGFTEPPTVTGVTPAVMACAYHKLMIQLGYKRFVVSLTNISLCVHYTFIWNLLVREDLV